MRARFTLFALALVVAAIASGAFAQNNRSFVATFGNDANNCPPGSECRSFTRALAVTKTGGEILAISSGGYGVVSIGKAITVMGAPGVAASLTVTSGHGIDVAAGPNDRVVLHGLNITITNNTGGTVGIRDSKFGDR